MKKLVQILLCLSLCLSVALSFACTSQELMFEGKYEIEATDEQIAELVADVDTNALLGEENVIGASITFNCDMETTTTTTYDDETETTQIEGAFDLSAKFSIDQEKLKDEDTMAEAIKASLNLNVDANNSSSQSPEDNKKIDGSLGAFLDKSGLYINLQTTTNNTEQTTKGRVDVEEIVTLLSHVLSGSQLEIPTINATDLEFAFEYLQDLGCKVYIDNSNGHKIKISITEIALGKILDGSYSSYYYDIDYDFDIETADLYIAIDKNGVLKGIKIDADVEYTVEESYYYGYTSTINGSIDVDLTLFMGKVDIATPNNLDTFKDMDLDELEELEELFG